MARIDTEHSYRQVTGMAVTLVILALSCVLFVQGSVRADLVAASALIALMLFGILTPKEALAGFSSSIVLMLAGVFIVGGAVVRTGLADRISRKILVLSGNSETRLFVLIMLVTAAIGAFVSNTGTVAVMLPIVVSLAAGAGASPGRFLMPLAFASTMGGMLTLIGTTPNMIISQSLDSAGYGPLTFFAFLPIGFICVTLGTIVLIFLSKLLVKGKEGGHDSASGPSLRELSDTYGIKETERRARVGSDSPLVGKPLRDADLRKYGVTVVEIRRKNPHAHIFGKPVDQIIPFPETVILAHDTFSFIADEKDVQAFLTAFDLEPITETDSQSRPEYKYTFDGFGIAELVLLSSSSLDGRTVREGEILDRFGVRVLGVRRGDKAELRHIGDIKLRSGDSLLVQGEWSTIARLAEERMEWVVVGQPLEAASKESLTHKAPVAAIIIVLMIAVMALNLIEPVTAVMLAAITLVFTGCFRNVEEAYKTISWKSVVLVAGMLPMATALEKTGAATLASQALISTVGDLGPYALLAAVYGVTSFVTLFVSNTAAGALCTPIALQAALNMNLSPYPFLFGVATAASMSLAFPFSTPPNVLVMTPGRYEFMDFVKVGGPLQILFGVVMVLVLPLLFPFTG